MSVNAYSSPRLYRHPHVRRFAVIYVIGVVCMLLLGLAKEIVGFSDALFTDLALGLVVLGAAATPLVLLGPHPHSNRDLVEARPPAVRVPFTHYGRLAIDMLTACVSAVAIVRGPTWVLALVIPLLVALAVAFWRDDARALEDLVALVLHRHSDEQ